MTAVHGQTATPSTQPLVQATNLHYLGAFKLPDAYSTTKADNLTLRYARGAVAFNPKSTTNPGVPSLFVSCFGSSSNVTEVSIPNPVLSSAGVLADLPTATVLQHCADVEAGATTTLHFGQGGISGMLVSDSKLYYTYYDSYPGAGCPAVSHFVKGSLNLAAADATGGFVVKNNAGSQCFVNGPMTWIPEEWRSLLGNRPAVTFNCCHSIISTTSWGPAAFAFDPSALGQTPIPSVALQWYSSAHPTLGNWNGTGSPTVPLSFEAPWNNMWSNALTPGYRGLVIPSGTRSALYFGAQGIGAYCYGKGTANLALHRTPTTDGTIYCYDPTDPNGGNKGDHAYPYRLQLTAFDLNDWAAAAAGRIQPYEVRPYAVIPLVTPTLPFTNGLTNNQSGGAAYDPSTRRIYFVQTNANGALPIVHVWEVSNALSATKLGSVTTPKPEGMALTYSQVSGRSLAITVKNPDFAGRTAALTIRDAKGKAVKEFQLHESGEDITLNWDRSETAGGIFFLTMKAGSASLRKAVSLLN